MNKDSVGHVSVASLIAIAGAALVVGAGRATVAAEPQFIGWTRHSVVVPPDAPRGYLEFQNSCVVCHGPMPERPGTRALAAKYKGQLPAMLEDRTDLQPAYIRTIVRSGVSVMPPFRKTELTDAQLDAIVAYLSRPRH
jgi:mono/diheme cytochrome c family protein